MNDRFDTFVETWGSVINLTAFALLGWWILPKWLYPTLLHRTNAWLYMLLILSGLIFTFLCLVPYLLEHRKLQPDDRPGILRYSAEVYRNSLFHVICFLVLSSFFVEMSAVSLAPDRGHKVFQNGDSILTTSTIYILTSPARGDIVQCMVNGEKYFRRVVGLPGESVAIVGGVVTINGKVLGEPYTIGETEAKSGKTEWQLSPDQYLLLPDDRSALDEEMRRVHRRNIVGKVFFRIAPWRRFGRLPSANYQLGGAP